MKQGIGRLFKSVGLGAAAALTLTIVQGPTSARADTMPPDPTDPKTPVTVAADPLPTVQIDGVAWTQRVVGNTVYVGGKFTTVRPAGAAPGTNTTARANLLAYDIRTGNLITTWAPTTNGDVLSIVPSPDNSRLYIGGSFTQLNGQIRNRIAAVNPTTGALINTFQPKPDATVRSIVATADTVYMGGLLGSVGGVTRTRVAAARASDGALLPWAPNAQGGSVHSLAMSPDGSQVLIGGAFTTMNGSNNPGYGLASVQPVTGAQPGASLPFAANNLIRNAGANAAITGLSVDSDSVYISGYVFGSGGNLEGIARVDWNGGVIKWVEDCHGDTYGSFPKGDVIYAASHAHYCGNLPDGFPQTEPWTQHYGTAFTKAATGTLGRDPLGYYNFEGNPSPNLLKWIPSLTNGTFTGQGQAGWNVTGNADYVTIGGEFPRAGNVGQQGLVRYAVREIAPNKIGPEFNQSKFNPTLTSFARGTVKISWPANWDRDNEELTYSVIRNNNIANPIHTVKQLSSEWNRPPMGYLDTGLVPGQEYRYRVFAKDPWGNEVRSDTVTIVVASDGEISAYAQGVLDDGARNYWRLGEPSGPTVTDWSGFNNATAQSGVTRGAAGAINGDTNTASTFNGTGNGLVVPQAAETGSNTFTTESWIKTTSTSGGKIVGFGNAASGNSGNYDRHVYMTNNGQLTFGAYPGTVRTVSSAKSYNDGQWHHVVATMGSSGMVLYVDGQKVAGRTDTTTAQGYTGYWRVGGDNLGGWPGQPASFYFNGSIDDVAIYPTALTAAKVREHYLASGRTLPGATPPADDYGKAVYASEPDLYWRLAESAGPAANDASPNQIGGTYNGGVAYSGVSGVGVAADKSVTLNGTNGAVASNTTFSNPSTYAEELWFKTTTTQGGKLIGFGSQQFGLSGSYDRHVWMFNDGRLTFGVWTGFTNTITTEKAYNDGQWHHVVAQQDGATGMKLYVDNELTGTNGQNQAQDYSGYWRIGGDNAWGGNSSNYFAGSIDDVAVYSKTLSVAEVQDHFLKGGGQLPNVKPTAAFTQEVTKRAVTFDASTSTDSDGTVDAYAWDFGDGATGTGQKPNHTYATVGDFEVTLTVTDNDGETGTITKTVTTVANAAPTAAFTFEVDKLAVEFDGSGSTDSDGTVASYAWDFGDGTSSTQAEPAHTYAAADDYEVTLTVTDNDGTTNAITKTVTTTANAKPTAAFTAEVDKLEVTFNSSGSTDTDGTIASRSWDFGDGETSTQVNPEHTYDEAGDYEVTLTVTDNDGATDALTKTVTATANVKPTAAFTSSVSDLTASFDGSGSSDTDGSVASYHWDLGDNATSTQQKPSHTYGSAGDYQVKLTVTDNDGATDSLTKTVTVTAPSGPLAVDSFGRTTSNGWGNAETGGAWTRYGTASLFSVGGGTGKISMASPGAGPRAALESVSSTKSDATVKVSLDKVANGGGAFISVGARTIGTNDYRAKVKVASNGALTLYLTKVISNAETTLTSVNLGSAFNYTTGATLQIRVQAVGTSPTTLRAKAWKTTQTEPTTWQVTTTDSSSGLQAAGGVGLATYLATTATNQPVVVSFDDLTVVTAE